MGMTNTETTLPHPFESAGLGKSPFNYVGMEEKRHDLGNGESKPGGTCDYCGNGILYCFYIASADGKRFVVGCDCVAKLERESNKAYKADKTVVAILRAANEIKKKNRHAREDAKINAGRAEIMAHAESLATMPHSKQWAADKGQTALDEFTWWMDHAGNKGRIGIIDCFRVRLGLK